MAKLAKRRVANTERLCIGEATTRNGIVAGSSRLLGFSRSLHPLASPPLYCRRDDLPAKVTCNHVVVSYVDEESKRIALSPMCILCLLDVTMSENSNCFYSLSQMFDKSFERLAEVVIVN